jgi:PIN domain nuclease of toxin-antitoxin system
MTSGLLLDTCVLLWILEGNPKVVGNQSLVSLLNSRERFFSSISVAEIEIKRSIGKLTIPDNYPGILIESGMGEIGFSWQDAKLLGALPFIHKDPFDRMLISTAMHEGLTIVTDNTIFTRYPVQVHTL